MDKEVTREQESKSQEEQEQSDAATKAKVASKAKAEELRAALETKIEQGKSSLGDLPASDD
jgi:hypothetical protein